MWSGIRRHLSYANIAATLALVFSMSAGAVAATHYLINSTRQINPKVLKKLKGKTGVKGAKGATGAQGPGGKEGSRGKTGSAGAIGPSTAFNTNSGRGELHFPSPSDGALTVSTLSLPAGNFSVLGKLIVDNDLPNESTLARCELMLGETVIDPGFDGVSLGKPPSDRSYVVLAGTGSLSSPGTATITCKEPSTTGRYVDRSITAIQVGSLG
jgi:hypothetical protein